MRILGALVASSALLLAACDGGSPTAPGPGAADESAATGDQSLQIVPQALPAGEVTELTLIDVAAGDGAVAEPGSTVRVHYTGWLYDPDAEDRRGAQFDSSRGNPQAFAFPLGAGRVIRGWDEGVAGMQVGGRRLLFIPPEYGYGSRGAGGVIPPNATLVFDVELLEVLE
jgi:FKBP-type peptidyl-prolyl cis-trans isomerase FkpA